MIVGVLQAVMVPRSTVRVMGVGIRRFIALAATLLWLTPACRSGGPEAKIEPRATELDRCVTSDDADIVTFDSADGTELAGAIFGEGKAGVVLAHMRGSDLCAYVSLAQDLAGRGYAVMTFDFRGHGSSGAGGEGDLPDDVSAAVALLEGRGVVRTGLVGASMGGTAVLASAAENPGIDGVVSISAPTEFGGVDALEAVASLEGPVLFIAAADDPQYSDEAQALYRATRTQAKEIDIFHDGGHGTDMLSSAFGPDVTKLILGFLEENVPSG
jgi:pimeloyl-ACP methyl ester carboxylesterase